MVGTTQHCPGPLEASHSPFFPAGWAGPSSQATSCLMHWDLVPGLVLLERRGCLWKGPSCRKGQDWNGWTLGSGRGQGELQGRFPAGCGVRYAWAWSTWEGWWANKMGDIAEWVVSSGLLKQFWDGRGCWWAWLLGSPAQ